MSPESIAVLIITGLAVVAWGFGMTTLKKVDANQTELFNRTDSHEHRITVVETQCNLTHPHRRATDNK